MNSYWTKIFFSLKILESGSYHWFPGKNSVKRRKQKQNEEASWQCDRVVLKWMRGQRGAEKGIIHLSQLVGSSDAS